MRNTINLLSSFLLAFLFAVAVFGQTGTTTVTTTVYRGLKNKPYSAESIRESVRTLPDGNTIAETLKGLEYRDGEGRTRREEVSQTPPRPFPFTSISIQDPVGGYYYSIMPNDKIVYRTKIPPPGNVSSLSQPPTGYSSKTEPLENRIIEGIEVKGSRSISTIAPGTIGNEKEIQTISEGWFSPELLISLLRITEDPRYGKTTTRLVNIKRDEPDKSLFEIPADYKIIDREPVRLSVAPPAPSNNNPNENKKP